MKNCKKIILMCLAMVLVASLAIMGTVAYLTSDDSKTNVMTVGSVEIKQIEQEYNADGELVDFTQAKPLMPYVGTLGWKNTTEADGAYRSFTMNNVVDKYVSVENTGKSDAYVRTVFAFEMGEYAAVDQFRNTVIGVSRNSADGAEFDFDGTWVWNDPFVAVIDGENYMVWEAVHSTAVAPDTTTIPSLLQVYMNKTCDNEEVTKVDGNENGTYDILVFSQAVQTAGFDSAQEALDEAFGAITSVTHPWVDGADIPELLTYDGVLYFTENGVGTVSSKGGDTVYRGVYSDGVSDVTEVVVEEGIKRLNNRAFCKMPDLKSVTLPESLTYIDEGVFQQSGFTTIEIPENVTYIGKTAFGACPSLETIIIKSKNVTLANYVGRDSKALKEVYIYSDTVTFETGSMYFTNAQTGDASKITFYVANQDVADALYNSSSASRSYGMLIKSIDGATTYYNTLK